MSSYPRKMRRGKSFRTSWTKMDWQIAFFVGRKLRRNRLKVPKKMGELRPSLIFPMKT